MAARRKRTTEPVERGEVLVAIMNDKADFAILQDQKWYRIPITSAPKPWPPKWLAFYQTKIFGEEAFAVNYYGQVQEIRVVQRRELFPNEIDSAWAERQYYQVQLQSVERLEQPIRSARWRRIVFIPTTWQKFAQAIEINDLYDESPLEDRLWVELKSQRIRAERQWSLKVKSARYLLDFAVFCVKGCLDIETDGNQWHANPQRRLQDYRRDNALQSAGWRVLRFNGHQIRESTTEYCILQIRETIKRLGGLSDEGLVPRQFYNLPGGGVDQLTLFDEDREYDPD